ncbi:hypothetical protein FA95DRAFT_1078999 [Auriscalpium vulgare]|uniref:Uncharacterized protein n=1 Tax=Auriscalpium vulgare TaxID=40419 RepID=A0ACB8R4Z6_9AGAM|nr:hypothetical protein FA95DRAFT_1078999 [Auriscalpium vulgare]
MLATPWPTMGAAHIGAFISSMLYGVTCIQTFHYYRSARAKTDSWKTKTFVLALLVCDSTHQALIIHISYYYVITHFADPIALLTNIWSVAASLLVGAVIACQVNGYLVLRIWRLSGNRFLVSFCSVLVIGFAATTLAYAIRESVYFGLPHRRSN